MQRNLTHHIHLCFDSNVEPQRCVPQKHNKRPAE